MLYPEASLLSIDILICKKKKKEIEGSGAIFFFPFINMNILPNT